MSYVKITAEHKVGEICIRIYTYYRALYRQEKQAFTVKTYRNKRCTEQKLFDEGVPAWDYFNELREKLS